MTDDQMRYDQMVENALRGVVRAALLKTLHEGLPGDHHFYLTFRTQAPGVSIPDYLHDQYPEEMTIVMQHQFWDLIVEDSYFSITLSFKNRPAELRIPYDALSAFVDPSVKFGLQFNIETGSSVMVPAARTEGDLVPVPDNMATADEAVDTQPDSVTSKNDSEGAPKDDGDGAEVVNLDQFRKK
ncbi:MAG: ClpXP protease specificity-enhancing factor SspB [Proteobacteria bacterium]|nr:ClpXP protease specificity-enhancing factor SspB [Pseudomonadota bacterium]